MDVEVGNEGVLLPRSVVRFPIELHTPAELRPDDSSTWPVVVGRLEYVGGRLLYMPPCGHVQQLTAVDVSFVLRAWSAAHPELVVGGNEAGMVLGGDTRAADAAVWRRADVAPPSSGFPRVPPLLAVEVAGQDEAEEDLRRKASWYLAHGVKVVWIVLPASRELIVVRAESESRHGRGEHAPADPDMPGLEPLVDQLFAQLSE